MSKKVVSSKNLKDIADAIRSKTGGSSLIATENMADEIDSIPTGGTQFDVLIDCVLFSLFDVSLKKIKDGINTNDRINEDSPD